MLTCGYPLRLRFLEGEEGGEGGAPVEGVEPASAAPAEDEGNPAWKDIRSALDPISFRAIEPHLKTMDQAAQQRITSVNQSFEPFKAFADQGVTPQDMQAALTIAQQVNDDPVALYEALGSFLEREGRLPNKQEIKQEVQANAEGEEQQPDPRLDTLASQNQQIVQFLQAQANAQAEAHAEQELSSEIGSLRAAHPELTDEDQQEVIRRAAFVAQSTGKIPSLEESYQDFSALRTRILTTPRPGDSAPKLLPTSGASAQGGIPQKRLGELSRSETQDIIASLVEANRD